MYRYYFEIAGLGIRLDSPVQIAIRTCLEPFVCEETEKVSVNYEIQPLEMGGIADLEKQTCVYDGRCKVFKEKGRFVREKRLKLCDRLVPCLTRPVVPGHRYQIQIPEEALDQGSLFGKENVIEYLALEEGILEKQGFLLHSSFVSWNGRGILFTGPSGVGKSTQARLWNEYEGAEICNGDRTVIRKCQETFYGFGSPWAGSSQIYKNIRVPVCAIILLSQGRENHMQRMKASEGFGALLRQTLVNGWNSDYMEKMLDLLTEVSTKIPMYHFQCVADESAVEFVKKELFL